MATRKVRTVEAAPGSVTIPFTEYQLDNGLTVLIHEDHSDPLVHVEVTYHVGSAREDLGRSGFAHFFEHMMFQGSKHVGDQEHFRIVTESGGTLNGTTNRDRTNYFETVPSNQLETVLWLESDRMGYMVEGITQRKFEIQRDTVKNEKQQNYENRPYGMVHELGSKTLYSYGHPYSWTTIGDMEDLDRTTVDDLKEFFLRYYGPNNALLTIAGDVEPEEALRQVEKYFGAIPRGPEVPKMNPQSSQVPEARAISYGDQIRFPMVQLIWPTVEAFHPDEAALDLLADLLGGGKSSPLYQQLVKPQKALQAYTYHPAYELAGEMHMTALAYPDTPLAETEKLLRQVLENFGKTGIKEEDVQRVKAMHEADFVYGLESARGKASRLGLYWYMQRNADLVQEDYKRYLDVTAEDVMRVFRKYVLGQEAVVLSVYPKGKPELAARKDNFQLPEKQEHEQHVQEVEPRTPQEDLDRTKQPEPGKAKLPNVPEYFEHALKNGISVIGAVNRETPSVALRLSFECGHWRDPQGQEGMAFLLAQLMQESTLRSTAEEMADRMERLGSQISISAGRKSLNTEVHSLSRNLPETLELVEELLFHPAFQEEDFERARKRQLEMIANQVNEASQLANKAFAQVIYGEDHIFGKPTIGTYQSVQSISLNDLRQFYQQQFSVKNGEIIACGDFHEQQLLEALALFGEKDVKDVPEQSLTIERKPANGRIYLLNKPDAPQSEIRVGYLAMPYDATGEYYRASIMNFVLGGTFNSRINLNLREDKGWTYGAGSFFSGSEHPGPYTVFTSVNTAATAGAVQEILKEVRSYHENGITEEELAFTKSSLGQRDALKYETNAQKLGFLSRIITYDLEPEFVKEQAEILQGITKAEIDQLAQKWLPVSELDIVVVGDASKVADDLRKLAVGEVVTLEEEAFSSQ